MMTQVLLDTDVVIHLLKKQPQTVATFLGCLENKTEFLLSPIVVAEVYAGAFPREFDSIETLFAMCSEATIDAEIGRIAGKYAKQFRKANQGISLEDYFLAATARRYACSLWTANRKHYPMDDIALMS